MTPLITGNYCSYQPLAALIFPGPSNFNSRTQSRIYRKSPRVEYRKLIWEISKFMNRFANFFLYLRAFYLWMCSILILLALDSVFIRVFSWRLDVRNPTIKIPHRNRPAIITELSFLDEGNYEPNMRDTCGRVVLLPMCHSPVMFSSVAVLEALNSDNIQL